MSPHPATAPFELASKKPKPVAEEVIPTQIVPRGPLKAHPSGGYSLAAPYPVGQLSEFKSQYPFPLGVEAMPLQDSPPDCIGSSLGAQAPRTAKPEP
jgi:hypothetical protein